MSQSDRMIEVHLYVITLMSQEKVIAILEHSISETTGHVDDNIHPIIFLVAIYSYLFFQIASDIFSLSRQMK